MASDYMPKTKWKKDDLNASKSDKEWADIKIKNGDGNTKNA